MGAKFTGINLHDETVEKLKVLRLIYPLETGVTLTNDEIVNHLIDSFLEDNKNMQKAFQSYMRKNATK